jgi:hypothetical protein
MRGDRIRLVFAALCACGCAGRTPSEPASNDPSCCPLDGIGVVVASESPNGKHIIDDVGDRKGADDKDPFVIENSP